MPYVVIQFNKCSIYSKILSGEINCFVQQVTAILLYLIYFHDVIYDGVNCIMLSISFIKIIVSILLSADRKMKLMLDGLCWFNSINCLTENDLPESDCMDMQIAKGWSLLWECASQSLCTGIRQRFCQKTPFCQHFQHSLLCRRKRDELLFCFRNTSLHQLLVCRHASGADADNQTGHSVVSQQSTMRVFAIVLFLWSEFKRNQYVHCLCCSVSNRCRSYLYGC